jgi:hypothetical protein
MADADAPLASTARSSAPTPREIVATPSTLVGKDEHRLEYINAMIALAVDDIRHVTLYVTFSLGIVALVVSQLPVERVLGLPVAYRLLLCAGVVILAIAALCYFGYVRQLHRARMRMVRCLPSLHAERVRELWAGEAGVWQSSGWLYKLGRVLLAVGLVLVGLVIFAVYIRAPASVE